MICMICIGNSIILMILIGILSLHCMLLLVETSRKLENKSFGEIGSTLFGTKMYYLVLFSIALAQMGFCCAYYIFVAQSLRELLIIFSNGRVVVPEWVFIIFQGVIYIPLSWVRQLKKFSTGIFFYQSCFNC